MQNLVSDFSDLVSETADIASRVAEANQIDYPFDPQHVAKDGLLLCDYFLLDMGRNAAKAFESKEFFNPATNALSDYAIQLPNICASRLSSFESLGLARFLDLIPQIAEAVLRKPTPAAERYLGRVADAYYLLFVLRQSPEVMQVVGKVVGRSKILLDASTVIPCMAEILMGEDERRMSLLFKAAVASGVELYVGQEAIDELLAAIRKARAIRVSDQTRGYHFGSSELIDSFHANGARSGMTFAEFLDHFVGGDSPERDLKLFLKHHLRIEFLSLNEHRSKIDQGLLEEMVSNLRPTRKAKGMDDEAIDRLVRNDVSCLMLVEQLRQADDHLDDYGFSWWWLTSDRAAYALDRSRQSAKACVCMSPDFLLRYVSIQPLTANASGANARHLPLAVDVAAIGIIPHEIKATVENEFADAEGMPKYLRIRRIRDLMNAARAPQEEIGDAVSLQEKGHSSSRS